METTKFTKVQFKRAQEEQEFTTEAFLLDTLILLSAKTRLPIKELLNYIINRHVDTISCSREDSIYNFFATRKNDNDIFIRIKEIGVQTIEFTVTDINLKKLILI